MALIVTSITRTNKRVQLAECPQSREFANFLSSMSYGRFAHICSPGSSEKSWQLPLVQEKTLDFLRLQVACATFFMMLVAISGKHSLTLELPASDWHLTPFWFAVI